MRYTNGTIGFVYVLPPRARRPICIDAQVFIIYLYLNRIINVGPHINRCKTGLTFSIGVKGRYTNQTMHTDFITQPSIRTFANNAISYVLYARRITRVFFYNLGRKSVAFGPSGIHTRQHLRPILGLGPAGTRLDKQKRIIIVGRIVKQCDILCRTHPFRQCRDTIYYIGIIWGHFVKFGQVFIFIVHCGKIVQRLFRRRFFLHQFARHIRVVP